MKHKQVTDCLRGGLCNKYCSCFHCTLRVCSVCDTYEGSLTTDCPGIPVDSDIQQEVFTGNADYRLDRGGWCDGSENLGNTNYNWSIPRFS